MKATLNHEKLERDLKRLRLPADLPVLSFDPDKEPSSKAAMRSSLMAAFAGVVCVAVAFAAVLGIVRWQERPVISPDPSKPIGPSCVSFPVDASSFEEEQPLSSEASSQGISSVQTAYPYDESEIPVVSSGTMAEPISSNSDVQSPQEVSQVLPTSAQVVNLPAGGSWFKLFWDGWIYYTDNSRGSGIYKFCRMRPDGSNNQAINLPASCYPVAFGDGWIYFTDGSLGGDVEHLQPVSMLYRMQPDGRGQMAYPGTEGAIDITLQDDWLYYVLDCSLYRMRTDGTHNQLLTEVSPYDGYQICEEGIFFTADISTHGYRHKMIRCDLDGGNPTLLLHEPVHSVSVLFIDQGYVYFQRYYTEEINGFQGEELCRMRLDGTEYQIITRQNDLGGTYEVRDGWIYYTHSSTDRHYNTLTSLCRVRVDGSDEQTLVSKEADSSFKIYGNYIYFTGGNWGNRLLYRVSLDGVEKTLLYYHAAESPDFFSGYFVDNDVPYVLISSKG